MFNLNNDQTVAYIYQEIMNQVKQMIASAESSLKSWVNSILLDFTHPIGSVYMSFDPTSPEGLFGGKWEQIKDRFILAAGDVYAAGSTGGSAEEKITTAQIPEHFHEYGYGFITAASQISGMGTDGVTINASTYSPKESYRTKVTGGSQPHNNMPPYVVAYVWRRIKDQQPA